MVAGRSVADREKAVSAGRFRFGANALLFLFAVVLTSGPFTEGFYDWDHFLTTGHDFELSMLGMLLIFGLVLVIARGLPPSVTLAAYLLHMLKLRKLPQAIASLHCMVPAPSAAIQQPSPPRQAAPLRI